MFWRKGGKDEGQMRASQVALVGFSRLYLVARLCVGVIFLEVEQPDVIR